MHIFPDFEADWQCICCKFTKKYTHLKKLYNEVEKELNKIRNEPVSINHIELCERLLNKYEPIFHSNHSFIVYLKYCWLSSSLGGDRFQSCYTENIDLKIIKLYEILRVFNIISPGFTLLRGR